MAFNRRSAAASLIIAAALFLITGSTDAQIPLASSIKTVDITGLKHLLRPTGRPLLVNFWATWCVPCREEMPSLAALARRAPDQLVVLAIDVGESRARVGRFLERYPVDLPILLDTRGDAAQAWRVGVYPSSYVIGPDGRIRRYIAGALDWNDAAIVRQLQPPLVTTTR